MPEDNKIEGLSSVSSATKFFREEVNIKKVHLLLMKTISKTLRLLTIVVLGISMLVSCKKSDTEIPEPALIDADSSSFSAIIVGSSVTEPTATGIVVVDIQKFYKQGKLVSTTIGGKVVTIKKDAQDSFDTAIDKLSEDFIGNEATFKNKASLSALIDESFKSKTGFIGSSPLDKTQIEKLFKGENIVASRLRRRTDNTLLAHVMLVSSGLSSTSRTSAVTLTINRFISSFGVGAKISGTANEYSKLGTHFNATANSRNTALMKDGIITVSSLSASGKTSQYSYSYPLPPSPSPIYGAPSWYWEKLTTFDNIDPFLNIPQGATSKGTVFSNFGNVSQNSYYLHNAKVVGNNLEFEYNSTQVEGSAIQLKDTVDISNGFETEFEFAGEKGQFLEVRLIDKNWGYVPFGAIDTPSSFNLALPVNQVLVKKDLPRLFDGKNHTVKIRLVNLSTGTIAIEAFIDDMTSPLYRGLNTSAKDIKTYFVEGWKDPNAIRKIIVLTAWTRGGGEGKMTIKRWSFKAL